MCEITIGGNSYGICPLQATTFYNTCGFDFAAFRPTDFRQMIYCKNYNFDFVYGFLTVLFQTISFRIV